MQYFIYLYFFRFSCQLIFGEAIFAIGMPRRKNFIIRLALSVAIYFAATVLLNLAIVQIPDYYPWLAMFTFILMWAMTLAALAVCFDISIKEMLFVGTGGYCVQHAGYSINAIIRNAVGVEISPFADNFLLGVLPHLVVGTLVYLFIVRKNLSNGELKNRDFRLILLALTMLASNVVFSQILQGADGETIDNTAGYICRAYSILCCFMSVVIMFGISRRNKLEHDNIMMEQLLRIEGEQHRMSKENIALINMKCHDLKHQISELRRMDNAAERAEYMDEIEKAVMTYDAIVKTGSEPLDIVLTEKSMYCENNKIGISCIADGERLSFISATDLYALFGNVLDNAIEAVINEPDNDKRLISIRVGMENNLLYVHVDNYCREYPEFENGIPITTKANKDIHGFGVRSIKYIVDKYGGEMRMYVRDGKFNTDIIFFLPTDEEAS